MEAGRAAGICPVIVGPTAVGKTALITRLARELPVEIISLDSRQVYHGLRIGTAQPSAEELAICPHHLIDFLPPEETYDAARYRADFCRVYGQVTARGGRPVVVGGAGLYLTAIREGFFDLGEGGRPLPEVRAELDQLGDDEIRRRLLAKDPAAWSRIHGNDRYRSQRALEIGEVAGRPMSELAAAQKPDPALGLEFPVFVLERPVKVLDARIAARTRAMLAGGWIEETRALLARHDPQCPGLGSLGYREIVAHLGGSLAPAQLEEAIVRVTRQYAKRQRTWFRKVEAQGRGLPDAPALAAAIMEAARRPASGAAAPGAPSPGQ
ncbi:MAG: tRNA (adenosine(37)-N6)-dimethylallyltransferase MiaA [bacterium]|nr:tRNA (adenosine(37)-N6)-dimethylallyltransferase MiaA [bacterium]